MKKRLLAFPFIFSSVLYSQTTLTQAFNEPKPGDIESTYYLDTSAFANGLPNISGANVNWNFSALMTTSQQIDSYYLSASSVTSSAGYPGCTFVQESGNINSYFKSVSSPTPQTEILGVQSSTMSIQFTNSGIIAKYPVTYGSVCNDALSGNFTFSVQGTCSGSIMTTADGAGTLHLPGNVSLNNVLRVKSVQVLTLTAFFTQVGTLKQTIYNYYHPSQKFSVLSISYTSFSSAFSSTPSVSGQASGSINYFVTGIPENMLDAGSIAIYPNPAHSTLNIALKGNFRFTGAQLYNQLGQCVLCSEEPVLDMSALASGVYFLQITSDKGSCRKKIVKE